MHDKPFKIEIYDKRQELATTMYVDRVADNIFRAVENEVFNCRLTLGTEFETRINKNGKHEIVRIVKESDFITKSFLLTSQFSEADYRLLGDEIMRHGGFWQAEVCRKRRTLKLLRYCKNSSCFRSSWGLDN